MKTYQFNFKSKGCFGIVGSLCVTIGMIIFLNSNVQSCLFNLSDIELVSLALKKDDKVYLMPYNSDKNFLEMKLAANEVPFIYPSFEIIEDDGELFVEPRNLENIFRLIAGDYLLYEKEENTFDGYVVDGGQNIYEFKKLVENTKEIGEQIERNVITIWDTSLNRSMEISWVSFPDISPEKNCIRKKIWVSTKVRPGEVVYSDKALIVIKLQDILEFFDNNTDLQYDDDREILYVIHKSN